MRSEAGKRKGRGGRVGSKVSVDAKAGAIELCIPANGRLEETREKVCIMTRIIRKSFVGSPAPGLSGVPSTLPNGVAANSGGTTNAVHDILKVLPPSLATFVANLPPIEGPSPDVDFVISICLQSNITPATGKLGTFQQLQVGAAPSTSDLSGSSKFKQTRERQHGKRKGSERQDDDDTSSIQSQPLPRDAFKIRQIQLQKSRASGAAATSSRTGGSVSYGSGFSGDLSASSG
ncbi:hypothetical protein BUALT_Bualt19G0113200 [Buddleja alternifolia]|uniref:Uncharacterized protein n=1 Tax=Buddleja alternifolia TaxID=168488 RepID=A0AAV6W8W5_9LAMI|nr:hypothetical protein BUALT_Bualt19G0113200 [Buddleja alternifolia]